MYNSPVDIDGHLVAKIGGSHETPDSEQSSPTLKREESSHSRTSTSAIPGRTSRIYAPRAARFPILTAVVTSKTFESIMLVVIILNCVTMGFEAENLLGNVMEVEKPIKTSEHFFTLVFMIEIFFRGWVFGFRTYLPYGKYGSPSNFMDANLVFVTGCVAVWILPLCGVEGGTEFRMMSCLRAMRMFRLVRIVKGSLAFKDVWLLLQGLISSYRTLVWTVIVIFFITYMFAVFGVVLISVELKQNLDRDGENATLRELVELVNGMGTFMLLLIQVLTLDSWTAVVRPMMQHMGWVWIYFLLYIAVAVLVLMNLVTAVIVENALDASRKNEELELEELEKQRKQAARKLRDLFTQIDLNDNGCLTYDEFHSSFHDPDIGPKLKLVGCRDEEIKDDEIKGLFHLLHQAEDGNEEPTISIDAFLNNFSRVQGPARGRDIFLLTKLVGEIHQELAALRDQMFQFVSNPSAEMRNPSAKMFKQSNSWKPPIPPSKEKSDALRHVAQEVLPPTPYAAGSDLTKNIASCEELFNIVQDIQMKANLTLQKIDDYCCDGRPKCESKLMSLEKAAKIGSINAESARAPIPKQSPALDGREIDGLRTPADVVASTDDNPVASNGVAGFVVSKGVAVASRGVKGCCVLPG